MSLVRRGKPNGKAWLNQHKCLICGAILDLVTHAHAAEHGYKNRGEFLESGEVRLLTG